MRFQLKSRAVNSKILFKEVNELVLLAFADTGITWASDAQRMSFVEMFDELMEQFYEEGKIEQWNIQSNFKNNTVERMANGKYVFEVFYKQHNCLNVTQLTYSIHDGNRTNVQEDILDFFEV